MNQGDDVPHDPDGPSDEEDFDDSSALQYALQAFRQSQRLLASFDFSAITAAQRSIAYPSIINAVQKSVNFSVLQNIAQSIQAASGYAAIPAVYPKWMDQLTESIDVSAIAHTNQLILNSATFLAANQQQMARLASIAEKFDYATLTKQLSSVISGVDWSELQKAVESWLPPDLRSIHDLDKVAQLSLEEGLPLAWVPRAEIVQELTSAATTDDRSRILSERFEEILDDCEAVLLPISHDWANQSRSALCALRQSGLEGPAQSHAANIIDSVVIAILGEDGRGIAKRRAEEPYEDLPLHAAVENLVLRPLFLGFAKWYPHNGDPMPAHFARHPTAHAVGHVGVFSRQNALIAVMLATSLTLQFWNEPGAP